MRYMHGQHEQWLRMKYVEEKRNTTLLVEVDFAFVLDDIKKMWRKEDFCL